MLSQVPVANVVDEPVRSFVLYQVSKCEIKVSKWTRMLYCTSVFRFKWTITQSVPSGFSCVLLESRTRFAVLGCNTDNKRQNIESSTVSSLRIQSTRTVS